MALGVAGSSPVIHPTKQKALARGCFFVPFTKTNISGCGSAGRAGGLGACLAVITEILQKSRKAFTYADFRGFEITQKSVDFEFDHSLSHFHAKTRKIEYISGCGAAGSAGGLGA